MPEKTYALPAPHNMVIRAHNSSIYSVILYTMTINIGQLFRFHLIGKSPADEFHTIYLMNDVYPRNGDRRPLSEQVRGSGFDHFIMVARPALPQERVQGLYPTAWRDLHVVEIRLSPSSLEKATR